MSFKLLSTSNPKMVKGQKKGYMSHILHLAPSTLSGYNTCPMASKGCAAACLNTSGHGRFDRTQQARIRKTKLFYEDRATFLALLIKDIDTGIRKSKKDGLIPTFRLNGTSDIPWENIDVHGYKNIMSMYDGIQFYDYTKRLNRRGLPDNYYLAVSRSETNEAECFADTQPYNVAVVFKDSLPETYKGRTVVDGDEHDLIFLQPPNSVIGLSTKGKAKTDASGFVVTL